MKYCINTHIEFLDPVGVIQEGVIIYVDRSTPYYLIATKIEDIFIMKSTNWIHNITDTHELFDDNESSLNHNDYRLHLKEYEDNKSYVFAWIQPDQVHKVVTLYNLGRLVKQLEKDLL